MNKNFGTGHDSRPAGRQRKKSAGNQQIYGIRAVMEAIGAGKDIESIFIQKGLSGPLYKELGKLAATFQIPTALVPKEKLNRLSGKNHQGVIALVSPVSFQKAADLVPLIFEKGEAPLLMILDRITDVRNFGAIARSAACMGAHALVIPFKGAAQVNPDAIKTSAGALYTLPLCREVNLKNTITFLQQSGLQVIACTEKASDTIDTADLTLPTAILMGSEEDGISPAYLEKTDQSLRIPIQGEVTSLNVSVAAGMILYEANRQRKKEGQVPA